MSDNAPYDPGIAKAVLDEPSEFALLVWADWLDEQGAADLGAAVRGFATTTKARPLMVPYLHCTKAVWAYGFRYGYTYVIERSMFNAMFGQRRMCRPIFGVPVVIKRRKRNSAASRSSGKAELGGNDIEPARAYQAAMLAAAVAWSDAGNAKE